MNKTRVRQKFEFEPTQYFVKLKSYGPELVSAVVIETEEADANGSITITPDSPTVESAVAVIVEFVKGPVLIDYFRELVTTEKWDDLEELLLHLLQFQYVLDTIMYEFGNHQVKLTGEEMIVDNDSKIPKLFQFKALARGTACGSNRNTQIAWMLRASVAGLQVEHANNSKITRIHQVFEQLRI